MKMDTVTTTIIFKRGRFTIPVAKPVLVAARRAFAAHHRKACDGLNCQPQTECCAWLKNAAGVTDLWNISKRGNLSSIWLHFALSSRGVKLEAAS